MLIGHPQDLKLLPCPVRILDTMYETTEVPDAWDSSRQDADAIIVPCEQQIDMFRNVGWTNPIHTVPCTFELSQWPLLQRPERNTFTFGCWARLSSRKMPMEIVQCFMRAFPDKDDVRLIMKTRNNDFGGGQIGGVPEIRDPRITVINAEWSHSQMLEMVKDVDCGIFLSHGEGLYHGPLQAMSTGIPCVMASNSGMGMYAKPSYGWVVGSDPTRPYLDAEGMGSRNGRPLQWWNPSLDETIAHMRYAYEHPREVKSKGAKAAKFVRKTFSEEAVGKQLSDVLNMYA
jgi:glycosyltransferase involved in cell wall biosynthesis